MKAADIIVALSTPPGRSGIGVIRLSGEGVLELTRTIIRDDNFNPEPNRVTLKTIFNQENGQIIDQALITYFKSPHSFTGEDVVELSCHGSPPLLLHIIDMLLHAGARAASPGEFTLRALSNGRLNLSQAEAIRDLIEAQTLAAVRQAARQLDGELSHRLKPIKETLLEIIVPLESAIEFVEDDLPEDITSDIIQKLNELITRLENLSITFRAGRLLKEGLKVSLVGRPNVGKSSIFNRLLERERAIVTDVPGTTRDSLSELINVDGFPLLLTDTAGLRSSPDLIERMGIERTRQAIVDADLILVVVDSSQPLTQEDRDIIDQVSLHRFLIIFNKSDLTKFDADHADISNIGINTIKLSAKTGEGIDYLLKAILEPFRTTGPNDEDFLITSARHYDLLRNTVESLKTSRQMLLQHSSDEIAVAGFYDALRFLGQITGETTTEDILSQIFSTFCIGK